MENFKKSFAELFNLRKDAASTAEIVERIHAGGILKGTNMCILVLAIFIASIGLNMNSTAVIIGAMLISPLMGNIIAIGYGMAAYDTNYVKKSFVRLVFQVFLSILTSAIYFSLTPITNPSAELLARTAPTIWDVLIAIFGGIAGIIGLTRGEIGNVVPGVAIATALMPPLCTAGYGIATNSPNFFWGATYLFFINSVFICLSAFFVLKILRVPAKSYVSEELFRRQRLYLAILGVIVILPSLWMAKISVQENLTNVQTRNFVEKFFNTRTRQAVSYKIKPNEDVLEVILIGQTLDEAEIANLQREMTENYSYLSNFRLEVVQNELNSGLDADEVAEILQNTLNSGQYVGIRENESAELQKYKNLSAKYYPAYQKSVANGNLLEKINEKLPAAFPKVSKAELFASDERFMAIIYVKEPVTADEAGRIKKFLTLELESPVILNIQRDFGDIHEIISGNGIIW